MLKSSNVSPFWVKESIAKFNKSGEARVDFVWDDINTYESHVRWLRHYDKGLIGTWDGDDVEMRISYMR